MKWMALLAVVVWVPASAGTAPAEAGACTRIASDFEIAQMKQQIGTSPDFLSQLSGHLNLGDLYLTRSETATALIAIQIATRTVWPMMNCGVPKNLANRSARSPKRSLPNGPAWEPIRCG